MRRMNLLLIAFGFIAAWCVAAWVLVFALIFSDRAELFDIDEHGNEIPRPIPKPERHLRAVK